MRLEDTPVPIPNTMVKIQAADGTMLETTWESRWLPEPFEKKTQAERDDHVSFGRGACLQAFGGIAQLGEHLPCKQGVKGSNPFISTIVMNNIITAFVTVKIIYCTLKTEYRQRLRTEKRHQEKG